MLKKRMLVFILGIVLTACSFNGIYLHPSKLDPDTKLEATIDYFSRDTVLISIGENFQPTFKTTKGRLAESAYSIESVLFENKANQNILNGWWIYPDSNANGMTMLFLHGNAGNVYSQYQFAVPFAERGFRVFIFDYSGFGFSEGEATRDNVLLDGNAAMEYVLSVSDEKDEPLIIYGQSLGGHLSAVLAAEYQDEVDLLVTEGAFSSHKGIASDNAGWFGRTMVAEKYSALEAIETFKKPVLVIHSNEDATIPFAHGVKLFDAANDPKMFYEIDKYHIRGPIYYADSIVDKMGQLLTQ